MRTRTSPPSGERDLVESQAGPRALVAVADVLGQRRGVLDERADPQEYERPLVGGDVEGRGRGGGVEAGHRVAVEAECLGLQDHLRYGETHVDRRVCVFLRVVGTIRGAHQDQRGRPRRPARVPPGQDAGEGVEGVVSASADEKPDRLHAPPGGCPPPGVDDGREVRDGDGDGGVVTPRAPSSFDQFMHLVEGSGEPSCGSSVSVRASAVQGVSGLRIAKNTPMPRTVIEIPIASDAACMPST